MVLHGYTHQSALPHNPDNGESGQDFEFFATHYDTRRDLIYDGPVPGDSVAWADGRFDAAMLAQPVKKCRDAQVENVCKPVGVLPGNQVSLRGHGHHFAERKRRLSANVLLLRLSKPAGGRQANRLVHVGRLSDGCSRQHFADAGPQLGPEISGGFPQTLAALVDRAER